MKIKLKQIILIGILAAITAVLSQISLRIPVSPVPITMQFVAVFLAGLLLGPKSGALSQVVYLLLGVTGLPVFANFEAGPGVFLSAKGGFLISFPIMAFIIGLIVEAAGGKKEAPTPAIAAALLSGAAVCYILGAAWISLIAKIPILKAVAVGVVPFVLIDLVKVVLTAIVGKKLLSALARAGVLK